MSLRLPRYNPEHRYIRPWIGKAAGAAYSRYLGFTVLECLCRDDRRPDADEFQPRARSLHTSLCGWSGGLVKGMTPRGH
jgi:hypothetical protein